MALSQLLDLTDSFNFSHVVQIDVGGWDTAIIQFVTPTGAIGFLASNDGGAVQGTTDGNATSATNFIACLLTNQATGATATQTTTTSTYKYTNPIGQYLQLSGPTFTITKLLVYLSKIS